MTQHLDYNGVLSKLMELQGQDADLIVGAAEGEPAQAQHERRYGGAAFGIHPEALCGTSIAATPRSDLTTS
jgi:hypothetical protein